MACFLYDCERNIQTPVGVSTLHECVHECVLVRGRGLSNLSHKKSLVDVVYFGV